MRRREFIGLFGTMAVLPMGLLGSSRAQQVVGPARIGLLAFGQEINSPSFDAFRDEMHRLGQVEGQTHVLEFRSAHGDPDSLRKIAAELARLPVDVIVADSAASSIAAKQATTLVPIVMAVVSDPIGIGLVSSLAHPGGNVTGFSILSPVLGTKRLALLKEAVPTAKFVGALWNPASPVSGAQQLTQIKNAASALDLNIVLGGAQSRDSIATAIDGLVAHGISALIVVGDAIFFKDRALIVELASAKRLPGIYPEREYAEAGGLLAYGPNISDNFRRSAGYVVRILKGEKPGDLPVEQPVEFDLVINLKTR